MIFAAIMPKFAPAKKIQFWGRIFFPHKFPKLKKYESNFNLRKNMRKLWRKIKKNYAEKCRTLGLSGNMLENAGKWACAYRKKIPRRIIVIACGFVSIAAAEPPPFDTNLFLLKSAQKLARQFLINGDFRAILLLSSACTPCGSKIDK